MNGLARRTLRVGHGRGEHCGRWLGSDGAGAVLVSEDGGLDVAMSSRVFSVAFVWLWYYISFGRASASTARRPHGLWRAHS